MARTDWTSIDTVRPADMNQIGHEINNLQDAISNIDIPDASLTEKGIVQLSNVTDGTRENVAPTEKALGEVMKEALAGKQLGVEQKANVVAVLNSKGITASTSETWAELIAKLSDPNVVNTSDSTLLEDFDLKSFYLLEGWSVYSKGKKLSGMMQNISGQTFTETAQNPTGAPRIRMPLPTGANLGASYMTVEAPTLIPSNIRSGVNILGVSGSMPSGSVKRVIRGAHLMTGVNNTVTLPTTLDVNSAVVFSTVTSTDTRMAPTKISAQITSPTTVMFRSRYFEHGSNTTVRYQIVEFNNVKSIQRGSTSKKAGESTFVSISPVIDMSKCLLLGSYSMDNLYPTPANFTNHTDPVIIFAAADELELIGFIVTDPTRDVYEYWEYQVIEFS
ncbi:phage tail protein [Paenibacillus lautus]|uniref:phage tail protein n=1 Tax=Paenibacillus lautus TaxID=1401 RepID=UPI00384AF2A0